MAQMNCANLYLFGEDIEAVLHDPEADSACIKGIIRHKKKNRGFLAKICSTI